MIGCALLGLRRVRRRLTELILRHRFARVGSGLRFDPFGHYTYQTIELGDDVFIGEGAHFSGSNSAIRIGSKVMFGPRVMIFAGDHNTSVLGRYMFDAIEKRPEDDRPVVINDDVWIGAGAIILKGVTVGQGCIIGAGAVVNRDVPPYAVVAGNPATVKKYRWSVAECERHETLLRGNGPAADQSAKRCRK